VAPRSRIAVLSPHLDDAAFSIGAFLHQQAQAGARVVVITVLAGDADADLQVGSWDARCGFESAAAAVRRRREEDLRACTLLGGTPVWLPYPDATYGARPSDDEVWAEVLRAIGPAEVVLIPGYPLTFPDHRFVSELVVQRRHQLGARLAFYAEQPYAAAGLTGVQNPVGARPAAVARATVKFVARARPRAGELPRSLVLGGVSIDGIQWRHHRTSRGDRRAKRRAVMSYRSQLRPIGLRPLGGAWLYEVLSGGEAIGWA
jgi:LmbE family N-acetylglucosaminyl deacetylase